MKALIAFGVAVLLTGSAYIVISDVRGDIASKALALALYCGGGAIAAMGLGVQLWREEFGSKPPD